MPRSPSTSPPSAPWWCPAQEGNRVGWLFLWLGLYVATSEAVEGYGLLAADTGLSDGQVGAWTEPGCGSGR